MLKINFLRNLLFLSLVLAAGFPFYDFFYTYPAYRQLLISQTESEASRFVRFLVIAKELDSFDLVAAAIGDDTTSEISRMKEDGLLLKLRIFNSVGKIVYSTQADEIGTLNRKDYFTQQVAQGIIYSKVVKKNRLTADGDLLLQDVVETYVPIMVADKFHGAVEVYYDITDEQAHLQQLNFKAGSLLALFSSAFVVLLVIGLKRAAFNFMALREAERNLLVANESLESRVEQRTAELQRANESLNAEIVVREQAESALTEALNHISEAKEKIDTILSSVTDALIVTDSQDRVVHMNQIAEQYFDIECWQIGCLFSELLSNPELLDKLSEAKDFLASGDIFEFDISLFEGNDREEKILAARVSPLLSEKGEQRGMVVFLQDVTKGRTVERMKSEFVSIAAHELRTPLTMILGYSELLVENRSFSEKDQIEFLSIINNKADDLSAIVDDLLDVARIEDGQSLELYLDKVDISGLIKRSVAEAEIRDDGAHRFKLDLPAGECFVAADQGRFPQVLENLLSNAVKYSPNGGEIKVSLGIVAQTVEISITDQGIGMTDEQIEHAFDRFYRADPTDSGVRGTGLGLSIVKYIVEAHGGAVIIRSQLGQGSSVIVSLPI